MVDDKEAVSHDGGWGNKAKSLSEYFNISDKKEMPEMPKLEFEIEDECYHEIKPTYNLVFQNSDGEVGRLEFDTGELVFKGDVNESTEYFLDYLCASFKQRIDIEVQEKVEKVLNKQNHIEDMIKKANSFGNHGGK